MIQVIAYLLILMLMAALQLIWTLPLPGLQGPPLFVLMAGIVVLWRVPRLSLYFLLVLISLGLDYFMGEGVYTALATLVAAQPPLWQIWKGRHTQKFWPFIPVALVSILCFEGFLVLCFSVRYTGAFGIFLQGILPALLWNLACAWLLFYPLSQCMKLLHYQESDYLEDAFKGNLG